MDHTETQKRRRGRPPRNPNEPPLTRVHVTLQEHTVNWASQQPGGISGTVRRCLEAMQQQKGGE